MSMGATFARYSSEGVQTVLVTCTGGELGEMLDPDRDPVEARDRLGDIRRAELECAVKTLGIDQVIWLGYRDSGMAGTPGNEDPRSFHRADFAEATRRLVEVVRREKPQVIVTYNESGGYGHPDHIMAHRVTVAAFDQAADPARYPDLGLPPWQVSKLYYTVWPRQVMGRLAGLLVETRLQLGLAAVWSRLRLPASRRPDAPSRLVGRLLYLVTYALWNRVPGRLLSRIISTLWNRVAVGMSNPFEGRETDLLGTPDEEITTAIDVGNWLDRKRAAWRCHRTQISEDFFLLRIPDDRLRAELKHEYYVRVRSLVDAPLPEPDLFSGLRG